MQWKSSFTALAAVALIAAVLGCGMDGPAPADNKGADNKSAGGNAGRAAPASTAASYNNLRQIGLAMQNYASTYSNAFPSAASVKNGKPYCRFGILAAMADGSVQRVNVDNATLKALITPAGGEMIDMRKITGGQ